MGEITLYTYAVSQSSEKVRWALDSAGLPYQERRLAPFVHRPLNATATGGLLSPMPVLEADGQTLADSTRILEWLETQRAPFSLIPRDPVVRAAVMGAESRLDHAGAHLLRWTYAFLLKQPSLALRLWSLDANPVQALALRAGFPLIKRVFERGLGFGAEPMERSRRAIDNAVQELNTAAEAGRSFLAGPGFSVADITAAALLAPLACPDEHPIYSRPDYRKAMKAALAPWSQQPGMDWVRSTYRRYRQPGAVEQRILAPVLAA